MIMRVMTTTCMSHPIAHAPLDIVTAPIECRCDARIRRWRGGPLPSHHHMAPVRREMSKEVLSFHDPVQPESIEVWGGVGRCVRKPAIRDYSTGHPWDSANDDDDDDESSRPVGSRTYVRVSWSGISERYFRSEATLAPIALQKSTL